MVKEEASCKNNYSLEQFSNNTAVCFTGMPEIEKVLNMCKYTPNECLNMPEYAQNKI